MAANNTITDDELRAQLLELGEDVGPVTATTRPLLLRKLKKLQKEGKAPPKSGKKESRRKTTSASPRTRRSPSRKLIGFSSDEESEDTSYKTRRRQSGSRRSVKREEDESLRDDIDGDREGLGKDRERGNSTVQSFSSLNESNITDDLSDSERSAYTGPFQRGTFRFRSFRRKRDSPESSKHRVQKENVPPDERSFDHDSGQDIPDGWYKYDDQKQSSSSFVNCLVLIVVLLCVALLLAYFLEYFPPSRNWITSTTQDSLPLCKDGSTSSKNCMTANEASKRYALDLFRNLSKKAGRFTCNEEEPGEAENISVQELDQKIKEDHPSWPLAVIKKTTLELLVKHFEDYSIRTYNKENKETNITTEIQWLDSAKPSKSLLCRIKQSINKILTVLVIIMCVVAVFVGFYLMVRSRWRKEEENTHKMYKFVENIIDILRKHHEACKTDKELPPYLPIPHVRDMLIKPSERQALSSVWNRAVRFLSANESRIRVESQRIAGEDFEVWRWIHIMSPKHHGHKMAIPDSKKPKCWQGQAFENFQWAVNPPIISPTPCLKIRNMFDPDVELEENWHVFIQDAILEKCIDAGANIVHIAVDKSSSEGCVYVKCDSHHSAGIAFKSLHGSWFDGRLVAVKYLTLRRYHQRFPKALTATGALKPSGTSPSSLVTLDPEDNMDINDSDTEV